MADLVSDILSLANAQSVVTGALQAGGAWAVRFPAPQMIKFFGIARGSCWLRLEGETEDRRLEAGDVFLLAAPRAFVLASDRTLEPLDALAVFHGCGSATARLNEGGDFLMLGGHVELNPDNGDLLHAVLPPLLLARAGSAQAAASQWLLEQLVQERLTEQPGAGAASAQLAQLLFIHILRAHLAGTDSFPPSWLRAVSDRQLAPALRLMHGEPGRPWQLGELAKAAGMSRTSFATRFRSAAGVPPLAYLTEWRMRLARQALRQGDTPVSELAYSLGYTSESAFSHAFKRSTGVAPKLMRGAGSPAPEREAVLED
jgi:AraC-like DNA-binding protein